MEPEGEIEVMLRAVGMGDLKLITNSWLENGRKMFFCKGVPNSIYYYQHHKILEQLIRRSVVIVGCNPDDPDEIYSWLCAEVIDNVLVVHYIWVRDRLKTHAGKHGPHRPGNGIGTLMMEKLLDYEEHLRGVVYTHETEQGRKFMQALYAKGILPFEPQYNPYLLFTTLPKDWNHVQVAVTTEDHG